MASYRETAKVALVHLDTTDRFEGIGDAIQATVTDTEEDIAQVAAAEDMTRCALDLLGSGRNDAYEAALATLQDDTRQWWDDVLARDGEELEEIEEPYTADVASLRRFPKNEALRWFETRHKQLGDRPLIREQAFGEAVDVDKLVDGGFNAGRGAAVLA
jgi:hypothetical protein